MHGRFVEDLKSSILVRAGFELLAGYLVGQEQLSGKGTCARVYK